VSAFKYLLIAALVLVSNANALTIESAGVGTFSNPDPVGAHTIFYDDALDVNGDVIGENFNSGRTFFWGSVPDPANPPDGRLDFPYPTNSSSLDYAPAYSPLSEGISIGKLTYYNGSSAFGTGAEFIDLNISIQISDGTILTEHNLMFRLGIRNIYNIDQTSDDIIDPSNAWAGADILRFENRSVQIGSTGEYLNLSFLPDPDDSGIFGEVWEFQGADGYNAVRVLEDGSFTALVVANIGGFLSPVNPVPEAGTSIALFALACMSLGASRRMFGNDSSEK
jgi:hypothetical protein